MTETMVHTAWLATGTNLGDRKGYLSDAILRISGKECAVIKTSSVYESDAWGYESSNKFFNQCLVVKTNLSPTDLLSFLKNIELLAGRESSSGIISDRVLDIDILFYDDLVLNSVALQIPHPRMAGRNFILKPLSEIDPEKVHPGLGVNVAWLEKNCADRITARRLADK